MIHSDYPEQWPAPLHWVKHNLEGQQVYGALFILRIMTSKYEFKSDEERTPVHLIVEETFPQLLNIFNRLAQIENPSIEVAEQIKLICKTFWSSIYLEIPKQLFDINVFNAWMTLFLLVLERPVPLEGQPMDPELRKSWGWWKVKKWIVHILNRLYTRATAMDVDNPLQRMLVCLLMMKGCNCSKVYLGTMCMQITSVTHPTYPLKTLKGLPMVELMSHSRGQI